MTKYVFLIIGIYFMVACSQNKPQDTIQSYINAHNEHDIDKSMSHYHQEIVFELKNTWTKNGVEEIKSLEVWDSAVNSNLKLESMQISGDSVFCKIIENNDWFAAAGIKDLVHDPAVFIVEDNKIKKIVGYPSEETGKKIQQTIGEIMQWSQMTQDSTIYELIPNGQFIYSEIAAQKWMELFSRWKSEQ